MGKPHRRWFNEGTFVHKCTGCRKAFQSNSALQQHNKDKIGAHEPRVRSRTRSHRSRPRRSGLPKDYMCDDCQRSFNSIPSLEQHQTAVNGRCYLKRCSAPTTYLSNSPVATVNSIRRTEVTLPPPRTSDPVTSGGLQYNKLPVARLSQPTAMAHHTYTPPWSPSIPPDSFLKKPWTLDNSLNTLAVNKLQPTQEFNDECGRDIDKLAEFLKRNVTGVAETLLGGSLKKGTAIRNSADADIVLFLNRFTYMNDFVRRLPDVIEELKSTTQKKSQQEFIAIEGQTRNALKLRVRKRLRDSFLDVDLLPAFDNLRKGKQAVYREMSRVSERDREYYSSSLAQLQLEFVKDMVKDSPVMKNLIRLVKYWRKTHFPIKEPGTKKFPTSYVLELITIHCWETANKPQTFNLEKAFKTVMNCLADYTNIDIHWTTNYQLTDFQNSARKEYRRPYVLDPANPFNNVCSRFDDSWEDVAELARLSADSPLLSGVTADKNRWTV